MTNDQLIGNLSVELQRTARYYLKGPTEQAEMFLKVAIQAKGMIDVNKIEPKIRKIFSKLDKILHEESLQKSSKDILEYGQFLEKYYISRLNTK